MSQKKIFVNGPVNVVRLSGKVGQTEKCIYVFFDVHVAAEQQTKCDDVRSEDVAKYMLDSFDLSNEKDPKLIYDFFFERGPLRPYVRGTKYKGKYLHQMSELFIKSFNIDAEKKIVQKSSVVPNVRFHYVDVRDYVNAFSYDEILANHQLYGQYNLNNFRRVYGNIIRIGNDIFALQKIIYEDDVKNPKIDKFFFSAYIDVRHELPKEYFDDQTKKTIYKIRNSYQNKEVKTIINKIIDVELKNYFNNFFVIAEQCLSRLQKLIDEHVKFDEYSSYDILLQQEDGTFGYGFSTMQRETNIFPIVIDIDLIIDTLSYIGAMLMDLYLLRRFLDKKYVTNALSYTGGYHSQHYILFLVKYFGFDITHYSYLKDNDIDEATKIIKKVWTLKDLSVLFYPPLFLQCSDMTNFPPLFT